MWYRETIAVCSQIHRKHINTVCGQNVHLLNVKAGGTKTKLFTEDASMAAHIWRYKNIR